MANMFDSAYILELSRTPDNKRLEYFLSIKDNIIDDSCYWQMLAYIWMGTDVCTPNLKIWRELFQEPRRNRHRLMKKADRNVWRTLTYRKAPRTVKVWRALNPEDEPLFCISWTLNKKVAERLANGRKVMMMEIPKECIVAYFNRCREQEIIYLWEEVSIL